MSLELRHFLSHLGGVVTLALMPVVFTAFVTLPATFHHHRGAALPPGHVLATGHMT